MVAGVFILLLLVLLFIGMPIGFVLLAVGALGLIYQSGLDTALGILSATAFSSVNSFTFSTIPLFILMAHFISKSNIAAELFESIIKWVGHKPGGPGMATVLAAAGFGTLSGSSVAGTAVMSQIAVPQMVKAKYSPSLASGLVASSTGTLAALIPPSIPLILYGIQTENSIGKLLIAGVVPGIIVAFLYCMYIVFVGIRDNTKGERYSWGERFRSLKNIWPVVLLVVIIVTVIYMGIGTATEAAAFGAFGALLIGIFMKRLNFKTVVDALVETTKQTAMIFTIIIGAHVFAYFIAVTRIGNQLITAIEQSGLSAWGVLILVILLYLAIGMFVDLVGAMLLTLPLIYPLMMGFGFDPIWFGIIVVLLLEIGLVTPPVGLNLFIASNSSGVPIKKVFFGTLPFIGILLFTILLFVLFPQLVLFLPNGAGS
ncbi:TRAP transporter large permease [Bacillus sp. 1P02SD]|uniref:TRAP transporter large permease n=1 Tax=Bacillus sp. 1P02SD TaxID=3132264 RepID=UPI0039A347BF